MSDVDHAARAREILDAAVESADAIAAMLNEPLAGLPRDQVAEIDARRLDAENRLTSVDRLHAAAQVHAALALVEQQRVMNLILLRHTTSIASLSDDNDPIFQFIEDPASFGGRQIVRPAVAAALGILP